MNPLAFLSPGRWLLYLALAVVLVAGYFAWADHIGDVREVKVLAKVAAARAADDHGEDQTEDGEGASHGSGASSTTTRHG